MNEVVFISIETSNFGHWNYHSREKNTENSNVEQTNAKHRFLIVKPPLSTTQNCHPSAVIGVASLVKTQISHVT